MDNNKKAPENEGEIDLKKYGFIKTEESKSIETFIKKFDKYDVIVLRSGKTYTVKIIGESEIMVANRFLLSSQKDLDFILFNGRAGVIFSSFRSPDKV